MGTTMLNFDLMERPLNINEIKRNFTQITFELHGTK